LFGSDGNPFCLQVDEQLWLDFMARTLFVCEAVISGLMCNKNGLGNGFIQSLQAITSQYFDWAQQSGSGGEDRTPDLGIMRPSLYH
jgi:hypothetical protein